jgi:hypothetical protein
LSLTKLPKAAGGANGKTIGMNFILCAVGLPKGSERFQLVERYFAAKERILWLGGFPKDMGGVITSVMSSKD